MNGKQTFVDSTTKILDLVVKMIGWKIRRCVRDLDINCCAREKASFIRNQKVKKFGSIVKKVLVL